MIIRSGEVLAIDLPRESGLSFEEKGDSIIFSRNDNQITAFNKNDLDSEVIKYYISEALENI